MAEFQEEKPIDLREYIAVLKARKWSLILITLLVVGSALGFSYTQTPIYSATARLLVIPLTDSPTATTLPQYYIATEAELLSSEPVAELVREDTESQVPAGALLGGLSVSEVAEASVLNLTFSHPDPETARDVANSFARSYITYKQQRALEQASGLQESIQAEIDEVTEELERLDAQLEESRADGDTTLVSSLEGQRSVLLAQLGVLQQRLSDAAPAQSQIRGGEVIQEAQLPRAPSSPNHIKNGVLAAFLGLALGVGLAFLRERLDDRFKGRADVERTVDVPVLATIPWFGGRRSRRKKQPSIELITRERPKGIAAEAYRSLRTNLQFLALQRSLKSIVVTSAVEGEGKTTTSSNLAVAIAQSGKRVIVVSADMRRPTLEKYFGIERSRGLSNWLMGEEEDLGSLIVDPGIPNLRILPCGAIPASPAELLTSINVSRLIQTLESNCDLLIFDAPPVLAVADAAVLSSRVGGTLLILNAASTHRSAVMRAKEEIQRAGGNVVGTVLNALDQSANSHYNYDSPYYLSPYTQDDGADEKSSSKSSRLRTGSER